MHKTVILWLCLMIVLAGCGRKASAASDNKSGAGFAEPLANRVAIHQDGGGDHAHAVQSQATVAIQVALVPSELVVGANRFAVGLLQADGGMILEAQVNFRYFDLSDPRTPALESAAEAIRLLTPDGDTAIFAHERVFERAGDWGVEVQVQFPDGTTAVKRIGFQVLAASPTLKPGQPAPVLDTLTVDGVDGDLSRLASASEPTPAFYELSLAAALTNGKPTVLLFATPAYCQTRFCGPAYEITSSLQTRYADDANFVHVEVYAGLPNPAATNWQIAPAMAAFGLHTEPWLYLIDRNGVVAYRVEGLFTPAEVEAQLRAHL
jgi:hypothetical protein